MRYSRFIMCFMVLVTSMVLNAQETLNANDPNTFIFGGDQKSNIATIDLQPITLVDIEADPGNAISFGTAPIDLEAGQPVVGGSSGGASINEDLWLNFTYRSLNFRNGTILVYSNMPLPEGMQLTVQVISSSTGGDYPKNPRLDPVSVSISPQPIVYSFASGYTDDSTFNGYQLRYTLSNPGSVSLPDGFEIIYEIVPQ